MHALVPIGIYRPRVRQVGDLFHPRQQATCGSAFPSVRYSNINSAFT